MSTWYITSGGDEFRLDKIIALVRNEYVVLEGGRVTVPVTLAEAAHVKDALHEGKADVVSTMDSDFLIGSVIAITPEGVALLEGGISMIQLEPDEAYQIRQDMRHHVMALA